MDLSIPNTPKRKIYDLFIQIQKYRFLEKCEQKIMIPSSSGSTNFEIPDRITTPVPHVRTRAILPTEARKIYH